MSNAIPRIHILGIPFARLDPAAALGEVARLHDEDPPAFVAHANVHTVNLASDDPGYADILRRADLVLNDGKGVMLAARMYGTPFPADLNGNFFSPLVLGAAASRGWPVFFFGARPGVADRAAARIVEQTPGLKIAGVRDGFVAPGQEGAVVAEIKASGASLVMVGLGNPLQERWIAQNLSSMGARLAIGVGAFFDFQAGEVARAPEWMNRHGLEWVFRLGKEPRRMWRRYLVGNPRFLARVARDRRGARVPS